MITNKIGFISTKLFATATYWTLSKVTSNSRVAFGGISPSIPLEPYARPGGITNFLLSPTDIPAIPKSHPLITLPAPSWNVKVP